jgi:RND family efflux transporter MFP subunit
MKRLPPGLALVALGVPVLLLGGCEGATPPLAQTEPPVVTVSQPLEKEITDYNQYTGRLEAAETVEVRARVRGELIAVHFQPGAKVKEGQPLFDLDPRTYKAALAVAEARKANAEAQVKLATSEYNKSYRLYQSKGAAASEVDTWAAKRGVALAEKSGAEAEIDRARLDVEFCTIKAPITGKISRPLVTKGNLVNAGGGDTLLTTIVSVDPIHVYFDVDEYALDLYRKRYAKEVGAAGKGKEPVIPVSMGLVSEGGRFPHKGTIDFAENRINPATGTITVRAVFRNEDGQLTPGQFARVKVPVGKPYRGLLVTDQAVGIDQGQKYVLVVNSQNKAEYRPVQPKRSEGGLTIFPPGAGLKAGEWVIVNGVQRVRPGVEVRPERVPMPTLPAAGARQGDKETRRQGDKKTGG